MHVQTLITEKCDVCEKEFTGSKSVLETVFLYDSPYNARYGHYMNRFDICEGCTAKSGYGASSTLGKLKAWVNRKLDK